MRLREIQLVVNTNLPKITSIEADNFTRGGTTYIKVKNYQIVYDGVTSLLSLQLFEEEEAIVNQENLFINTSNDVATFDVVKYELFVNIIERISYKASAIDNLITKNLHSVKESNDSLIISLPNRSLNFDEFSELIGTLENTFKMMRALKEFQSDIIVSNFDIGTEWLVISFISEYVVSLFGKLVTVIQRTQAGNRQLKALDAQLESIDVDEELRHTVREAQKQANLAIYSKLTKQFLETNDLDTQAETLSQMTKVTENLDKLLSSGVSFEAAVSASNDVAKTFPTHEEQKKLDQAKSIAAIKSISDGS